MRKLKLQVQMSLNGYIAGPHGEMDWMTWDWDDALKQFVDDFTRPIETILLGGNMALGFMAAWAERARDPEADWSTFKFHETPKVIFSRSLDPVDRADVTMARGDLSEEVLALKAQPGGDIAVYGGARFVSDLIKHDLIDEYNLFINPVAIREGMPIFGTIKGYHHLQLVEYRAFACGIIVITYVRGHKD